MIIKNINEFKAGDKIQKFFLVKSMQCRVSSNNKMYLDLMLGDKTGEMNAKLWDCVEGDQNKYIEGAIVKTRAVITEWQNNLQIRIEKIRIADENDNVNIDDFVQSAPYDGKEMYSLLKEYIEKIQNNDIKNIVNNIIANNEKELLYFPAAKKNHHSVRYGLLYHTTTMLKSGEKLCEIYDFLNRDLIFAGVILHDIAKIREMDSNDIGIVNDYTPEGHLLGHIVIGVEIIGKAAEEVGANSEIAMLLKHMILSHHYEPEFGSPKKPMIPEAEMLHFLDIIDARMYDMKKAVTDVENGQFSDKIWSLDGRKIYKAKEEL